LVLSATAARDAVFFREVCLRAGVLVVALFLFVLRFALAAFVDFVAMMYATGLSVVI
jgi:hypothetical protein